MILLPEFSLNMQKPRAILTNELGSHGAFKDIDCQWSDFRKIYNLVLFANMMEGWIFLSGGGTEKDSFLLDKAFSKTLIGELLYIPIAINPTTHPYKECERWIRRLFKQFGYCKIAMWTSLGNQIDSRRFSGVYLGGGNTYKLLKTMRESGFDDALLNFHNQGGHIYGGSAGAIVCGANIKTTKNEVNRVGLKDFKGLNLIKGHDVLCHYRHQDDDRIKKYTRNHDRRIICLPNNGGIISKNGKLVSCGCGKCYIFGRNTKITI